GTDTNNTFDIYVRDRQTQTTYRVNRARDGSQTNNLSTSPRISRDGRYITFVSGATNLLSPDPDSNAAEDVFVQDLSLLLANTFTGLTRVSLTNSNGEANSSSSRPLPAIAGGELLVAFTSNATNLISGDTNAKGDVFLRNVSAGTTERVSTASGGEQLN